MLTVSCLLLLASVSRLVSSSIDFCEQTVISNIFTIESDVYVQTMKHYWQWKPNDTHPPQRHSRIPQIVFFNLNASGEELNLYLEKGFNGFLMNNLYTMWRINKDEKLVMGVKIRDQYKIANEYTQLDEKAKELNNTFHEIHKTFSNCTSNVYYYSKAKNKLIMGCQQKTDNNIIFMVMVTMNPIGYVSLQNYSQGYGKPRGFWEMNGKIHFLSSHAMGIVSDKDKNVKFIITARGDEKELRNKVQTMLGCGRKQEIREVSIEEINWILMILTQIFGAINIILLVTLGCMCYHKYRNKPNQYISTVKR